MEIKDEDPRWFALGVRENNFKTLQSVICFALELLLVSEKMNAHKEVNNNISTFDMNPETFP